VRKLLCAVAMATLLVAPQANAEWPEKAIRIVVPYAPGGSTDNVARSVQPALEEILGQSITIENIGGGAGLIGTAKALKDRPDSYTFSMNPTSTMASIYTRDMPYDVEEDVQPVARVARSWVALAVHPSLPVSNIKEFVAYAKENRLTYSSAGVGGITHVYMELIAQATGIEMTHVPYRGSSGALNALLAGHVNAQVDSNLLPQLVAGGVKGIGYINNEKWPGYPELATLAEQGVDVPHLSWFGLVMRKGSPAEAYDGMAAAVEKALERDDVKERLLKLALYPGFQGPSEFADQIKQDQEAFKTVLTRLGMIKTE
jgi:tripartite-type tricarboxylate transporter receptor subunit TctC